MKKKVIVLVSILIIFLILFVGFKSLTSNNYNIAKRESISNVINLSNFLDRNLFSVFFLL